MRDGKGTIEIVTMVTMAPFTVTVSEHVEWDPDKAECAEAKQRAVVAAQTIADYIRLMPDAANTLHKTGEDDERYEGGSAGRDVGSSCQ